jgi:hypothetical protein
LAALAGGLEALPLFGLGGCLITPPAPARPGRPVRPPGRPGAGGGVPSRVRHDPYGRATRRGRRCFPDPIDNVMQTDPICHPWRGGG